jgi:sugar (pentulose or hexulose) kinase
MREANYFMGIDTGTQSLRVSGVDINGNIIASDEQVYETYFPKPGWAEQKPSDWWECLNKALENVSSKLSAGIRRAITTVSVCSTSSTVLAVDKDGAPLTDAIMWMDTRAVKEMETINATKHPI